LAAPVNALASSVKPGRRGESDAARHRNPLTEPAMNTRPTLVIGATGKTGRRIAARLAARGHDVRPASRRSPVPFDWEAPATWPAALDGAGAAYISYFPDLAFPGAADKVAALAAMAKQAGVERVVLLSGRGERRARLAEAAVAAEGPATTRVRTAWFAQNFSEGVLREAVMGGVLAMPGGAVAEPIVDVDDIADVATAALSEDGHAGRLYEVTGPRLLTFAEMADTLAAATGRPVRYMPIGFEDFHAAMTRESGAFIADVLTEIARETLDGRNASLGDGVQQALGRPPRDFADFARDAAAAGAFARAA
jgi:uncharacterized protein YbjT (DUF2867 family)